jgi:hypothetical protein
VGNIIKVPAQYAVNQVYANIKNAMQLLGEECLLLRMIHVNDAGDQPRCSTCYNDVYKQIEDPNCLNCYGTTFEGGIREVWRVWAIFDDQTQDEKKAKDGVWGNEDHEVQTEPFPELQQNDYAIRVKQWDSIKQAPLELGLRYRLGPVSPVSVRTGSRFSMTNSDRVAQKFHAIMLPISNVIYSYNIALEVQFPRYDNQRR